MNYRMLGIYKRPINFVEKLSVGWRQMLDNRWEWWYHLTQAEPEEYIDIIEEIFEMYLSYGVTSQQTAEGHKITLDALKLLESQNRLEQRQERRHKA